MQLRKLAAAFGGAVAVAVAVADDLSFGYYKKIAFVSNFLNIKVSFKN